ncbi:MAG: hypothetical protein HYZ07_01995, partial [Candidatus Harrisonbacteria bacterium]|nr:hypothetical protein [Candidatus Harrisonbacteria bacterium]
MANEPNEPAKPEVQDLRDVPPVDARDRMWRAVKLYAVLAGMLLAAWGLLLLTAWVYEQRPPMPSEAPFAKVRHELRHGMNSEEVWVIMSKYLPPYKGDGGYCSLDGDCEPKNGGIRGEPIMYHDGVYDPQHTETVDWTWRSKEDRFGRWIEHLEIEYYN